MSLMGLTNDSHKFVVKFIDFKKADDDQKRILINSILTESYMLRSIDHENIEFFFQVLWNIAMGTH